MSPIHRGEVGHTAGMFDRVFEDLEIPILVPVTFERHATISLLEQQVGRPIVVIVLGDAKVLVMLVLLHAVDASRHVKRASSPSRPM